MDYNDINQYNHYDIETFEDWLLIECRHPDGTWTELENPTFGMLCDYLATRNLTGFNNHGYDDVVLSALYYHHLSLESKPEDPIDNAYAKKLNDQIINGEKLDLPYHKTRLFQRTFDVQKYMKSDLGYATLGSLKTFENAHGMAIEETPVPFDRSLVDTASELIRVAHARTEGYEEETDLDERLIEHVVDILDEHGYFNTRLVAIVVEYLKDLLKKYCRHDVEATREFHKLLIDRKTVESVEWVRSMIAEELGVSEETLWYKSANSLVIKYFEPELGQPDSVKYNRQNFFDFIDSWDNKWLQAEPMKSIKEVLIASAEFKAIGYEPLIEEFAEKFGLEQQGKSKRWKSTDPALDLEVEIKQGTFTITYDGFVFGLGGIHSHQGELVQKGVFDADVDSLHPSTMMAILALGSATDKFKKIVARRLEAKRTGNKAVANALKIVINSIYGLCRSQNSGAFLYGETIGLDVCIAGELLIYWLAKEIQSVKGKLVQTNTDGIMYTAENDMIALACSMKIFEVSSKTGYTFSSEFFKEYYAKDVNNYFIVDEDGKVGTTKGALFNKKPFGNNQAVGQFIIDYLTGKPKSLADYLKENPSLLLCRAKVNRQFKIVLANEIGFPRFSEKTGKMLKGLDYTYCDVEQIGQQVRGYPVTTPTQKMVRKYIVRSDKYGLVGRIADRLSTEIPSAEELDYDYYADLILDNLSKIRLVSKTEELDIQNILRRK
ncbi:MAG: hypothetical protein ACRCX2_38820 [Paraclostridium sp.]